MSAIIDFSTLLCLLRTSRQFHQYKMKGKVSIFQTEHIFLVSWFFLAFLKGWLPLKMKNICRTLNKNLNNILKILHNSGRFGKKLSETSNIWSFFEGNSLFTCFSFNFLIFESKYSERVRLIKFEWYHLRQIATFLGNNYRGHLSLIIFRLDNFCWDRYITQFSPENSEFSN